MDFYFLWFKHINLIFSFSICRKSWKPTHHQPKQCWLRRKRTVNTKRKKTRWEITIQNLPVMIPKSMIFKLGPNSKWNCAETFWKIKSVLTDKDVNLLMGSRNFSRILSLELTIEQKSVRSFSSKSGVGLEKDVISSTPMPKKGWKSFPGVIRFYTISHRSFWILNILLLFPECRPVLNFLTIDN